MPDTRRLAGRIRRRALVTGLALLLTGCAGTSRLSSAGSGPTGQLVFSDGARLWTFQPDVPSAGHRQVASAGERGQVSDPAWSPDGRRIAYSSDQPPAKGVTFGADIHVVDAAGGVPAVVFAHEVEGGFARTPVWSPDGAFLYFSYVTTETRSGQPTPERRQRLLRLDLASKTTTPVAENAYLPTLSPDGQQIAFLRFPATIGEPPTLWLAGADGGAARSLVPATALQAMWAPRFSPTGEQILVMGYGGDRSRPLLDVRPRRPAAVGWPPSVAAHGLPLDLWLVEVATGRLQLLAALGADDLHAVWAPDGKRVACLSAEGLFLLDLTTAAVTQYANLPEIFGILDWSH